jgi:hypothetical protein
MPTNPISSAIMADGFMEPDELFWLYNQAKRFTSIVEVGCWKGKSTIALAEGCSHGMVYTIDTFLGSPSERDSSHIEATQKDISIQARANLEKYPHVKIMQMTSLQASRQIYFADMIFIDGDHEFHAVMKDLACWSNKAQHLLCGHDINMQGVQEALSIFNIPYDTGPGSIWYTEIYNPKSLFRRFVDRTV